MLDQFLWGHSSRVCDISCLVIYLYYKDKKNNKVLKVFVNKLILLPQSNERLLMGRKESNQTNKQTKPQSNFIHFFNCRAVHARPHSFTCRWHFVFCGVEYWSRVQF